MVWPNWYTLPEIVRLDNLRDGESKMQNGHMKKTD
jgi:hypothetical protein